VLRCVGAGPRIRLFIEKLFLKEIPCLSSAVVSAKASAAVQSLEILPSAILSVGTAGGLASNSRIRDVVVASETVFKDQPHNILKCAEGLVRTAAEACSSEGIRFCVARVVTSPKAIINIKERHQLHELTGGHVVDMESHAVALEAAKIGVPFSAIRVISDNITSAPFPEPRMFRELWQRPAQFMFIFPAVLKWTRFIRDFRKSIEVLPPALLRVIRNFEKLRNLSEGT
jgi:uridine phosphorylase